MNKLLNSSQFSLAVSTITSLGLGYYIYTSNSRLEEQIRIIEDRLNKMDQVFKQTLNTVSNSKDENQDIIKNLADDVNSTRTTIELLKDATELMAAKMGYVAKKKSKKYNSRYSHKTATKTKSRRSRDDSDRDRDRYRGERTKGRRNRSTRYDESDSSTDVSSDDSYSDSTDYSSDEQPIASSKKSRRNDRTDRKDRDRDRGDRTTSRRDRGDREDRGERTKGRGNKRKDKDRYEDESDDMDDLDELAAMMNSMNVTGEETA